MPFERRNEVYGWYCCIIIVDVGVVVVTVVVVIGGGGVLVGVLVVVVDVCYAVLCRSCLKTRVADTNSCAISHECTSRLNHQHHQ